MTTRTWTSVREAIEQDIARGHLVPGDRIPTEPELMARYGVGRHSLRRAIAALAKAGRLRAEQGRGTFVTEPQMLHYEIGARTRLRQNLAGQTRDITRALLEADTMPASARVAAALRLAEGAPVHVSRRLTSADGVPIACGAIFHDAARFPAMRERRAIFGSMTETYRSYGIADYLRAETTLDSRPARPEEARILRQHPDLAVTIVRAVDALPDGTPIAFSEVVWAASRVRFSVVTSADD